MAFPLLNRKSFYRFCKDSVAVAHVLLYTSNDGLYYLYQACDDPDIFHSGSSDLLRAYTSLDIFLAIRLYLTCLEIIAC